MAARRDRRPRHQGRTLIQCAITDRRLLGIERNLSQVDWIQIRDKDLCARDLLALTETVQALPNPRGVKILVNTRVDVALATGISGAHLPANSPAPSHWRSIVPPGFLLGVSTHSVDEVRAAEQEGADYVFFGPVFDPLSKPPDLPARGLEALAHAATSVKIPVLALGGIAQTNIEKCLAAGAAGVAGISLFQSC